MLLRQCNRLAHDVWVARVEPARHVGGGDVLHYLLVEAHLPGAEALPHVAVEIYLHLAHLPLKIRPTSGPAGSPPCAAAGHRAPEAPLRDPRTGSGSCRWSWSGP